MARSNEEYDNESVGLPTEDRTIISIGTITSMPPISMGALSAGTNNIGTITALQGTNPWIVSGTVDSSSTLVDFERSIYFALMKLIKNNESLAIIDSSQRQKITIDSISSGVTLATVTTVATVTDVTSVNRLAGNDARYIQMDTARNAFANGIRANISIT